MLTTTPYGILFRGRWVDSVSNEGFSMSLDFPTCAVDDDVAYIRKELPLLGVR